MFSDDLDTVVPFVYEDESTLSLHFDMSAVQSRMRRGDPAALEVDYTRVMMGCLLLCPQPRSMLMIGLGGGSLPKYCYRTLPQADITVVEINPHVIALRETFHIPSDDERFRVVRGNGAKFVAGPPRRYDVILVDGFTYEGQPSDLSTPSFYATCRALLEDGGVLVVNLHDDGEACDVLTDRIAHAFDDHFLSVSASDGRNRIVFAAEADALERSRLDIQPRLAAMEAPHRRTLRGCIERLTRAVARPRGDRARRSGGASSNMPSCDALSLHSRPKRRRKSA